MKRFRELIILILLAFVCSCGSSIGEEKTVEKVLVDFESVPIVMPQLLLKIQAGSVEEVHLADSELMFIIYVGPDECALCEIIHMNHLSSQLHLADYYRYVHSYLLVSPSADDVVSTVNSLREAMFPFPVYVCADESFHTMNVIPNYDFCKFFLLDMEKKPIFVGDPFCSLEMNKVFDSVVADRVRNLFTRQ